MTSDPDAEIASRLLQANARAPTIRKLATVSAIAFGVLALVGFSALIGSSAALRHAMDAVSRNTRSAALASELEVSVLMYQRLSNLHVLTGESGIDAARDSLTPEMRRVLAEADSLVDGEQEQRLLNGADARLDDYLARRHEAEAQGLELAEIVKQVRPALSDALADLRSLRELNNTQVIEARSRALTLDRIAKVAGASSAVMLIVGFLGIAWGVRRFLVRPVVALHDAMARFSTGELDARAVTAGVREVDELSRMFNDMAAILAQQRQAQLTFLAGVAHDLKNPLSTLKTGIYVMAHEPSEVRRGDTRAELSGQVDLLNRMLGDLLDATRIEAGQLELRRVALDLRGLIDGVVSLYVPAAPEHHFSVRVPDEPVVVDADSLRMEQVLRNLISNAIKFSPYGGPVTVALEPAGDRVVLSVSDRGIGMTSEDIKTIFLPFRRRKLNVAPGAGLGLSVVRRIVRAHGGTIDVESEPGEGSILPRDPAARAAASAVAALKP